MINVSRFGGVDSSWNKRRIIKWVVSILVISLLVGGIYIAFFSGIFNVKKISVALSNNSSINKDDVEVNLTKFLNKNMLWVSGEEIQNFLRGIYPVIKEVQVIKSFPATIEVQAEEYQKVAIVIMDRGKFIINEKGIVVGTDITEGKDLLKINFITDTQPAMYQTLIKYDQLYFIFKQLKPIYRAFNQTIRYVNLDDNAKDVRYQLDNGWILRFEVGQDVEKDLNNLQSSLSRLNLNDIVIKEIDLRISGKIFLEVEEPDKDIKSLKVKKKMEITVKKESQGELLLPAVGTGGRIR
jgi:cell division septal protein FtsQ